MLLYNKKDLYGPQPNEDNSFFFPYGIIFALEFMIISSSTNQSVRKLDIS